jgi:prepilin-type N-terminal cleavage/methylation domain-containing protein/prepilin-type processing-associated H-X9-DG protein
MPNVSRRKKGFTLIELLVVIAIIAILAAILFPSVEKARASAQATACMGNLQNLGLALNYYTNAYNQAWPTTIGLSKLPSRRLPEAYQKTQLDLVAQLKPWIKNQEVWFDKLVPADGVEAHFAHIDGDPGPVVDPATGLPITDYRNGKTLDIWSYRAVGTTYLFNQFTIQLPSADGYPGHVYQGLSIDAAYDPSRAVAIWDDPSDAGPILEKQFTLPHNEGINVFYLDGHIAWVPIKPLGTEQDPESNIWTSSGALETGWLENLNPNSMGTCGG